VDSLTLLVALGFAFAAVYIMARTFFHQEEARSAKQLLGDEERDRKASNAIIKYSRPFFSRYVVPIVLTLKIDNYRKVIKRKLISSGMSEEFTPDELFAFKLFLIIGAPIFAWGLNWVGELGLEWWAYPLLSILGFYYPDLMLNAAIKTRQSAVRRAMPFIVDLLALSTEAGLDFMGAIGKVVEKAKPSPLVDELGQVLKEIKIGSSRADALREMAQRLSMQEISSFVAILISADQMGASIGKVLRQQSEQIRNERFIAGEREGAKAVGKILIPLFLFILPAIMISIFTPFVLQMMADGGFGP
jgi:tight adherence protein C